MTIEGVPEGWELVGFLRGRIGDHVIDGDGKPYRLTVDSGSVFAIIRKIEKQKVYRQFANGEEFKPHRDRWIRRPFSRGCFKLMAYSDEGADTNEGEVITWERFHTMGYVFDDDGSPFGVEVAE